MRHESDPKRKPIYWIASARKDMKAMPTDVRDVFGKALLDAQFGDLPDIARPFGEGVRREVWKLVDEYHTDTYRAAYTAHFEKAVYVLDVFMKKAKQGIATPQSIRARIEQRFQLAEQHYRSTYLTPHDR
jgi:phage-related protein